MICFIFLFSALKNHNHISVFSVKQHKLMREMHSTAPGTRFNLRGYCVAKEGSNIEFRGNTVVFRSVYIILNTPKQQVKVYICYLFILVTCRHEQIQLAILFEEYSNSIQT